MSGKKDVIVIGAGAIGVCSAFYLSESGFNVTLLDRDEVCAGCSYGNSGLLVPSHVIPLASPGVIWKALKWVFNPESPFYIRPRLSSDLISWLWKFRSACSREHVARAMPVIHDLTITSIDLFKELADICDDDFGLNNNGVMHIYDTEDGFQAGITEANHLFEFGLEPEIMDKNTVTERLGGINVSTTGGVFHSYDGNVAPDKYVHAVSEAFKKNGGRIENNTRVDGFQTNGHHVSGVVTNRGLMSADEIVLSAGSWSPNIANNLGIKIPIQPAKGYSVTYKKPEGSPEIPIIFGEQRIAMSPIDHSVRLAGTLEMAGMNLSINRRRLNVIAGSLGRYFPDLRTSDLELLKEWSGLRPITPDGLPLIGRWPTYNNVTIAAGHGMIGMSTSPATGKLVSQILAGNDSLTDLSLLDPSRFAA